MRKLMFLFVSIILASFMVSCEGEGIGDGDICDHRGKQVCEDGMLMVCDAIWDGAITSKWKTQVCGVGAYCRTYQGKSDCYQTCTRRELGQRNEKNPEQICKELGKDSYFYVY